MHDDDDDDDDGGDDDYDCYDDDIWLMMIWYDMIWYDTMCAGINTFWIPGKFLTYMYSHWIRIH